MSTSSFRLFFESPLLRVPLLPFTQAYKIPTDTSLFECGIYLSSKPLYDTLQKIDLLMPAVQAKVRRSITKYHLRACTRCTPYATFAGVSSTLISSEDTSFVVKKTEDHQAALRLDMDVVTQIIAAFHAMPQVLSQLTFTTNNSLYHVPYGYRYAEYSLQKNGRKYHLSNLTATPYLNAILTTAAQPVSFQTLAKLLQTSTGANLQEIVTYLHDLIRSQVLISNLELAITGSDPFSQLVKKLEKLNSIDNILVALKRIKSILQTPQVTISDLKCINESLADTGLHLNIPDETLQADLFLRTKKANINESLLKAIADQVGALLALSQPVTPHDLEIFKKRFLQRYEEQWIPLAQALDADLGIGYGNITDESIANTPLINELPVFHNSTHLSLDQNSLTSLSLKKFEEWINKKESHIEIRDEDIKPSAENNVEINLPTSLYILGRLMKDKEQLNKQHFSFAIASMGGPTAANLLGRFAYNDENILSLTRSLLEQEESSDPDAIFAEIAHLPQARIGNILLRPLLRKYEIPYVGLSGADKQHQISIDDIWVKVEENEIILWSRLHNKRVIPRLSTAHNFSHQSLPIYKFLCDLQFPCNATTMIWDWGPLNVLKYLPRVKYKNIIVHQARWLVDEKDIEDSLKESDLVHETILKWQQKNKIPNRVVYAEGDNELMIDFLEEKGRELFLHYLKRYKRIKLHEFLFTEENAVVHNEQGQPFTNELIIPLCYRPKIKLKSFQFAPSGNIQRIFSPNSEWVYYKIYCGAKTAETILKDHILRFVETGIKNKYFDKFFFIRYKDESTHIRLRFLVLDPIARQNFHVLFHETMNPLLVEGLIQKIVCDTYVRELERYGGDCIVQSEELFHNDSLCVLRLIGLLQGDDCERHRLFLALAGIDLLLKDFGLSLAEKQTLISGIHAAFHQEFGGQLQLRKALNNKYRQYQKEIFRSFEDHNGAFDEMGNAFISFQVRSQMNRRIIELIKNKTTECLWMKWLPSYIHMFMNRLFVAQQRKNELVVYHFLERYYSSQLAIQKSKKQIVA